MKIHVVKAGGSGNIIETDFKHPISWMDYRKFQIDSNFFDRLCDSLQKAANNGNKIAYVNGGVAAYLFIQLGEKLNLEKKDLDTIGCQIVNLTSKIILEALKKRNVNVFPDVMKADEFKQSLLKEYDVIIVEANSSFTSTDSLAAFIASRVNNSKLMIFKKGIPTFHVGFESPTKVYEFRLKSLEQISENVIEKPGNNSILDKDCIKYIRQYNISTSLYNADDIELLPMLIEDDAEYKNKTLISF